MLSIVEVKCPHCGAEGRIMLPPMGSIILGPCPECSEMVVVFCGRVLPLDKEIVTEGSIEQRKAHLLQVLTQFLRERIDLLVKDSDPNTLTGDDLGTGEVDELMAEAQAEDIERARASLRGGMMWHGRERLAQSYYRQAVEHHAQGEEDWALFNLDLALRNYPRFLSAIRLKEQITQAREWEDDASIVRSFLTRLIMRERGIDEPTFGRPGPPFEETEGTKARRHEGTQGDTEP